LGSRSKQRADEAAAWISAATNTVTTGMDNLEAARTGEIVVLAVPWASHDQVVTEIAAAATGKIVVDAVVPLVPPKVSLVQLPADGTAAQRAQRLLPGCSVVGAFHNIAASKLQGEADIDCDVLVCGNDREAREQVIALARDAGMRGIDAGQLANSVASEALTSILIGINRRYGTKSAGIRITGLPDS
jgi:hypothetical protein